MSETYLVTGVMGCLGAWVAHHLVERGARVVGFDLSEDRRRLDLLLDPSQQESIVFVKGDLSDERAVSHAVEANSVTRMVHLAALQIPFCRANPSAGARVNVVGTVNVFEAARRAGITHLSYASSAAVYGPPSRYASSILPADARKEPATLYGAYKVANEVTAGVYAVEHGISSIALRPYTVYGVGRDQGTTSEPTTAMLEAARGRDSHISFGGRMQFHFASDAAHAFIAAADAGQVQGAHAFNLGGDPVAVTEVAAIIEELRPGVSVSVGSGRLPFPEGLDSGELDRILPGLPRTELREGIRRTLESFEASLAAGRLA